MHESEAMEFLEIIYCWFAHTKYEKDEVSDDEFYLGLEKIRDFIRDDNGYWVKEKATFVADDLLDFESNHKNLPEHLSDAIDESLKKIEGELFDIIKICRSKNIIKISVPFPNCIGPREVKNTYSERQKDKGHED